MNHRFVMVAHRCKSLRCRSSLALRPPSSAAWPRGSAPGTFPWTSSRSWASAARICWRCRRRGGTWRRSADQSRAPKGWLSSPRIAGPVKGLFHRLLNIIRFSRALWILLQVATAANSFGCLNSVCMATRKQRRLYSGPSIYESTVGEGRGRGTQKEDKVRVVAWILHCRSVPNADKGGKKNPKFLRMSFMDGPIDSSRSMRHTCGDSLEKAVLSLTFFLGQENNTKNKEMSNCRHLMQYVRRWGFPFSF